MELISTHTVKKSDLGFHSNLFGGKLLSWLDAAAAAYAAQVCDTPRIVTVCIRECNFNRPAKEGQLLKIYGDVQEIGTSSITLGLEARSHNVYTGRQNVVLETTIKFVRIDEEGNAIPISDKVKQQYEKIDNASVFASLNDRYSSSNAKRSILVRHCGPIRNE
jgi:acyl-CoA thioesterase YciA